MNKITKRKPNRPSPANPDHPVNPVLKTGPLVSALLAWFATNARDLPWRRTSDPYAIWVSEIMISDTYTAYGSVVRLHGKSLAFLGNHSSNFETMAAIFRWCGVTRLKYMGKTSRRKARPFWPPSSSISSGGPLPA